MLAVFVVALQSVPAHAAFPGQNGKIAFSAKVGADPNYHLYTVNPDGTGQTQITTGAADDTYPAWSPDGTKIAFSSSRNDPSPGIYVANADGSGVQRMPTTAGAGTIGTATWSPDGTRIAYDRGAVIWSVRTDGSDPQRVTPDPGGECTYGHARPRWSPDGGYIAINTFYACPTEWALSELVTPDGTWGPGWSGGCTAPYDWAPDSQKLIASDCGDTWTIARNGDFIQYYPDLILGGWVVWSPDGTRLILADPAIHTVNFDGSGRQNVASLSSSHRGFDWQPILKGYPRPKGAGSTYLPLVPAYDRCTTPNRIHAPPLSHQSCAPPQKTSPRLTLGTPDANGPPASSTAYLKLGVNGVYTTPADDAEIGLQANITDVRNHADLSDYTGALELRFALQITDKSNTPYPGGPGPGTVQALTYSFTVPCTATTGAIGSTCAIATTADALAPDTAIENRRAIWQLGTVEARDGGPDGDASTPAGNTTFLRQGVFVP